MRNLEQKIAVKFCELLKEELTEENFKELQERTKNKPMEKFCYLHEYIDANMLIFEAHEQTKGEFLFTPEDFGLINNAWTRAKENLFNL